MIANCQIMKECETESINCSLLLDEMKEMVRILKTHGVTDADIEAVMHKDEELPYLTITEEFMIYLGDEREEVHLEPLVKSVYLLFLKHPEGINFKDLPDYRDELTRIYDKVRPWGLTDRALRSIEDVTTPTLNSINEKCARIRRTFVTLLGNNVAEKYYIKGKRGHAKKIALPRNLVVWE